MDGPASPESPTHNVTLMATTEEQIASLESALKLLTDELSASKGKHERFKAKIEKYVGVAVIAAVVFGVTGASIWTSLRTTRSEVEELTTRVSRARTDLEADKTRHMQALEQGAAKAGSAQIERINIAPEVVRLTSIINEHGRYQMAISNGLDAALQELVVAIHEIAERSGGISTHPPYKDQMTAHSERFEAIRIGIK